MLRSAQTEKKIKIETKRIQRKSREKDEKEREFPVTGEREFCCVYLYTLTTFTKATSAGLYDFAWNFRQVGNVSGEDMRPQMFRPGGGHYENMKQNEEAK